ncbi:MAG: polyribonucleotide nucleotidyltransferase, partial [Gammaproteobacteria bacterium]|nr:polyribonucleotide nucleotidyltransferase [Gammaproteobacteria bacterium]
MQSVRKEVPFGGYTLSLETGEIARQAYSVIATAGETVVLAAVTARKTVKPGQDFFPLTVDIVERTYAAGRVPGGFFKRETRPSEKAVLNARLTDRVLRPMFPNGFLNEVQVVITVLSVDPEIDPDIPGLVAACAALSLSGIPFKGPVAAARVGYVDDKFLLNPTAAQQIDSQLDLVVGANRGGVVMVESEANILPEAVMLDAVLFAHEGMSPLFDTIDAFVAEVGEPAWEWQAPAVDQTLADALEQATLAALGDAYGIMEKQARVERISELRRQAMADFGGAEGERKDEVDQLFKKLEKRIVRGRVLAGNPRIDGRTTRDVRPVYIRNGLLPRAHGSALFTRGETQALVVSTLGTGRDAQIVENLIGGRVDETFMLHYNFPPYSVGETGRMGPTKRRELGHGKLAKRALNAVIPSQEEFPYVLRLVSEITESNGSSSMASVCG